MSRKDLNISALVGCTNRYTVAKNSRSNTEKLDRNGAQYRLRCFDHKVADYVSDKANTRIVSTSYLKDTNSLSTQT